MFDKIYTSRGVNRIVLHMQFPSNMPRQLTKINIAWSQIQTYYILLLNEIHLPFQPIFIPASNVNIILHVRFKC